MRPLNGLATLARSMVPVAAMLASTLVPSAQAQAPQSRADDKVKVLVPAYFYPTWWVGSPWDDLNRAASKIPIEAIMNPASGPDLEPNPDYMEAVTDFRAAGGKVIGYVDTNYGNRPFDEVCLDIRAYFAWYDVDGIFLDRYGDADLGGYFFPGPEWWLAEGYWRTEDYYKALDSEIRGYENLVGRRPRVVGNAGTPFPPVEDYLEAVDTMVIFEGPLSPDPELPWDASFEPYPDEGPYAGWMPLPLWFQNYRPKRLANLVYGVPSADAMMAALDKAIEYNAGYVYVTDDILPNPWDTLPEYWDQVVNKIAAFNASRK